jgi:hypothetical protein
MMTAEPSARYLVVLHPTEMDEPSAARALVTIQAAAQSRGGRVREEARFETPQGVPVLALVVVEGQATSSAPGTADVPRT